MTVNKEIIEERLSNLIECKIRNDKKISDLEKEVKILKSRLQIDISE